MKEGAILCHNVEEEEEGSIHGPAQDEETTEPEEIRTTVTDEAAIKVQKQVEMDRFVREAKRTETCMSSGIQ